MKLDMSKCLVRRMAFIQLDVALAIVILMFVFIPLTVTSSSKLDLARRHQVEAVVLQLIDGEIDVLLAGEQQKYNLGPLVPKMQTSSKARPNYSSRDGNLLYELFSDPI